MDSHLIVLTMIAAARKELDGMEAERERLNQMIHLGEEWLRVHDYGTAVVAQSPAEDGISYIEAVRCIITAANGEPIHRLSIPTMASALGAQSKAKNEMACVDTNLRRLCERGEIERVPDQPGYWRTVGCDGEQSAHC